MRNARLLILAAIVLLVVSPVLAAEWTEKRVEAVVGEDGVQRVEIIAGGFYFDPNTIVVKVNVPVELVVKRKSGLIGHNIMLKEPEAGIEFAQKLSTKPKPIAFTPTKTGKYMFVCTHKVPLSKSHRERGMYGFIEVVE